MTNQRAIFIGLSIHQVMLLTAFAAFTFLVFVKSVTCDFVNWDDSWMVLNNPFIRSLSFENVSSLFTNGVYAKNYQPLVFLGYAIEHHFVGLNPTLYHLDNVFLHVANSVLVFVFLRLVSRSFGVALVGAVFFAIHPLRVESVTWVTARRDLQYGFFFLLSIIAYTKSLLKSNAYASDTSEGGGWKYYFLALFFFVLSCLSKGMAVSLTLVVILVDYLLLPKITLKVWIRKLPFLIVSLIFGIVTLYAVSGEFTGSDHAGFNILERMRLGSYAAFSYFQKLAFPFELSTFYPYLVKPGEIPLWYWAFPALGLGLMVLLFRIRFTHKKIVFGAMFFFFTIGMVLQFLPVGFVIIAERYTYLPSIGAAFLVGLGVMRLNEYFGKRNVGAFSFNVPLALTVSIILLGFASLSFKRIDVWRNSTALWNDVIDQFPGEPLPYHNRGDAKYSSGLISEAKADYLHAYELDPGFYEAAFSMGVLQSQHGQHSEAIEWFSKALANSPSHFIAVYSRGVSYMELGVMEEAMTDFQSAIEINDAYSDAYYKLAEIYYRRGDKKALLNVKKAIALDSVKYEYFNLQGLIHLSVEDNGSALQDFERAVKLDENVAVTHANRGLAKVRLRDFNGAILDFSRALLLEPNMVDMYYERGNVKAITRDYQGALEDFSLAILKVPTHVKALRTRGILLYKLGDSISACTDWEKAGAKSLLEKYCRE